MRGAIIFMLSAACATPDPAGDAVPEPVALPPEITAELASVDATADLGPIGKGELPWWFELSPGIYRFDGALVVLAVGESKEHHHVAEGFLESKVRARLAVRQAAERIRFAGPMPEPELLDLFITREQRFFALYRLRVPADAQPTSQPVKLEVPRDLHVEGMHRRGRHVFEDDRHLFLECDVEGPIANPDWGRSRASARY